MARKNIPLIARLRQRLKSLFPKSGSRRPAAKGPNQRLRQRSAILIIIILVFGFGATLLRLGLLYLLSHLWLNGLCFVLGPQREAYTYDE